MNEKISINSKVRFNQGWFYQIISPNSRAFDAVQILNYTTHFLNHTQDFITNWKLKKMINIKEPPTNTYKLTFSFHMLLTKNNLKIKGR